MMVILLGGQILAVVWGLVMSMDELINLYN